MEKRRCNFKFDEIRSTHSYCHSKIQFSKYVSPGKNTTNLPLKDEEDILNTLKEFKSFSEIREELSYQIKRKGSQPPRLYGLAKVHKNGMPLLHVLSMLGSHRKVALKVTEYTVRLKRKKSSLCHIFSKLNSIEIDDDEVLVSFDVNSLYTNVLVNEAIDVCAEYLFSGKYELNYLRPVNKTTLKTLL